MLKKLQILIHLFNSHLVFQQINKQSKITSNFQLKKGKKDLKQFQVIIVDIHPNSISNSLI
jgi:hypothetical protein